tara:strand:+ start:88 stop:408 length:321 start_codon:yes stop_codon:yes gene_type:complete
MILEIILSVFILILGYTTWTQMRRVESLEDVTADYEVWIDEFIKRVDIMDENLKQIDAKGTFEADDEVGTFFKSLRELQARITNFIEETTDGRQTNNEEEATQEEK